MLRFATNLSPLSGSKILRGLDATSSLCRGEPVDWGALWFDDGLSLESLELCEVDPR